MIILEKEKQTFPALCPCCEQRTIKENDERCPLCDNEIKREEKVLPFSRKIKKIKVKGKPLSEILIEERKLTSNEIKSIELYKQDY